MIVSRKYEEEVTACFTSEEPRKENVSQNREWMNVKCSSEGSKGDIVHEST